MAVNIEVIFTGLALFCLNEGEFCKGKLDTVYLLNGKDDAKVCGRELDGGHKPTITFDARYLLPGSTQPYSLVPTGSSTRSVLAYVDDVELCICEEDRSGQGCPRPNANEEGARPLMRNVDADQEDPRFWKRDENSFAWVPELSKIYDDPNVDGLCPQVEAPLPNKLVSSRIRMHTGTVSTAPAWGDKPGKGLLRWFEKILEIDYLVYEADHGTGPVSPSSTQQKHFPKAMPGHAMWRIPDLAASSVILLQDCRVGRPQRTLFRLRSAGEDIQLYISNAPTDKHPLPHGFGAEHFRWYYRVVDWPQNPGCSGWNQDVTHCPAGLPIPRPRAASLDRILSSTTTKLGGKVKPNLESMITLTDKCPPGNSG